MLSNFPHRLVRGDNPVTGLPVIGFELAGRFVFDPYKAPDIETPVDPLGAYGLTAEQAKELVDLNRLLAKATEAALDAGFWVIQQELGAKSLPPPVNLSARDTGSPIIRALADYLLYGATQKGPL